MLIYGTECSAFAVIGHIVRLLFHLFFYRDLSARADTRAAGAFQPFIISFFLT